MAEDTTTATPSGTMPTTDSPPPAATTEARAAEAATQAAIDKAAQDALATTEVVVPAVPAAPPAPVVPDKYELKLPDGSPLDAAATERIAATARELGLSNDAAQKMVDLSNAELVRQEEAWKAEALADPTLGATPEERKATVDRGRAVLRKFSEASPSDAEAFADFLEGTGLGSNPATVRFFAWLGKAMGEGKVIVAGPGEGQKKPEHRMYNEDGSPLQSAG